MPDLPKTAQSCQGAETLGSSVHCTSIALILCMRKHATTPSDFLAMVIGQLHPRHAIVAAPATRVTSTQAL